MLRFDRGFRTLGSAPRSAGASSERIGAARRRTTPHGWTPPVDLCETAEAFVLTAELPGLTRDRRRHPTYHDGRLTLQGRGATPRRAVRAVSPRRARPRRLLPRFALPAADRRRTAITADLKDGVLTVTVPEGRDAAARRIDVTLTCDALRFCSLVLVAGRLHRRPRR